MSNWTSKRCLGCGHIRIMPADETDCAYCEERAEKSVVGFAPWRGQGKHYGSEIRRAKANQRKGAA